MQTRPLELAPSPGLRSKQMREKTAALSTSTDSLNEVQKYLDGGQQSMASGSSTAVLNQRKAGSIYWPKTVGEYRTSTDPVKLPNSILTLSLLESRKVRINKHLAKQRKSSCIKLAQSTLHF